MIQLCLDFHSSKLYLLKSQKRMSCLHIQVSTIKLWLGPLRAQRFHGSCLGYHQCYKLNIIDECTCLLWLLILICKAHFLLTLMLQGLSWNYFFERALIYMEFHLVSILSTLNSSLLPICIHTIPCCLSTSLFEFDFITCFQPQLNIHSHLHTP